MAVDGPEKIKLFSLPEEDGSVKLQLETATDPEIEQKVIETITGVTARDQGVERTPASGFWRVNFGEAGSVYLKPFFQRPLYVKDGSLSHLVCAVDISNDGNVQGWGMVIKHPDTPGAPEPPFVATNRTKVDSQRQGLGTRRLVVLNEASQQIYGEPLVSGEFLDSSPDNPEIRAWEHLVASGLAIKLGDARYCFK